MKLKILFLYLLTTVITIHTSYAEINDSITSAALDSFQAVVMEVGGSYKTHLLATYLFELATRFHFLYSKERIITEDISESSKRLGLAAKTGQTLKDGLYLLGIEVQEQM